MANKKIEALEGWVAQAKELPRVRILDGKNHRLIGKCLEFQGIAARVEKEHGCLLAGFALESDMWFDQKFDAFGAQSLRKFVPLVHLQNNPEMAHWYRVAIHLVR